MDKKDMNCFCGRWPFYKVNCDSIAALQAVHRPLGITGGLVSSLEAIFYQDPLVAELDLATQLQGTPYRQAMVLNPTLPGWKNDLARCVRELHIAAVRLTPGLHGYRLTDARLLDPVCRELEKWGLPLLITVRLEDERCTWMLKPTPVTVEDIRQFADAHSGLPILLTGLKNAEFSQLADCFARHERLYADISCFSDGGVRELLEKDAGSHLLFGSGVPLLEAASAAALLTYCGIDETVQGKIYSGQGFAENEVVL